MELDPQIPAYSTSDRNSFAYISCKDRWPIIITGAIDDVHRTTSALQDETALAEGRNIIEGLSKLKYEIQHDRPLTQLPDDGKSDVEGYNRELESLGYPSWFNVPWLFSECYLYRRISTFFTLSTKWKHYDVFSRQKLETLKSSRPAVLELAARYKELLTQLRSEPPSQKSPENSTKAQEVLFMEMCEICLWGNATDLSLLTNVTYESIQKLQGSSARKSAEANILVNDLPAAFSDLKKAQEERPNEERRVDIVLDNAGFELFVDLVLAGYLTASGLATTIVLHPKSIPWFVSDVMPADFGALLNALADPQSFFMNASSVQEISGDALAHLAPLADGEIELLQFLFEDWSERHAQGQLIIRPNIFWTHAGSYWRLPSVGKEIFSDLMQSQLAIFKGDLNYRKLTGDVMWPPTTPFHESLGPLANKGEGLAVLALRTCKADVVVGLPAGLDERVKGTEDGGSDSGARKWAWSGKYALVQYYNGKSR